MSTTTTPNTTLKTRMGRLFNDPTFSDIKVRAGKTEFHCHLSILSTCTDFFTAAINSSCIEATSRVVALPEHTALTVRRMLDFCYTGDYGVGGYESDFGDEFADVQAEDAPTPGYHFHVWALADYLGSDMLKYHAAEKLNHIEIQVSLSPSTITVFEPCHMSDPDAQKQWFESCGEIYRKQTRVMAVQDMLPIADHAWGVTSGITVEDKLEYTYTKETGSKPLATVHGDRAFIRWLLMRWLSFPHVGRELKGEARTGNKDYQTLLLKHPDLAVAIVMSGWKEEDD